MFISVIIIIRTIISTIISIIILTFLEIEIITKINQKYFPEIKNKNYLFIFEKIIKTKNFKNDFFVNKKF